MTTPTLASPEALSAPKEDVMQCGVCNWIGKRSQRVVAWCSVHHVYSCSHCFIYRGKC